MTFADLGLGDGVLRAVADAGYTQPTPIQEQAIPVVLMGRDVLGCAQTGTGKTAGFTLPMIEILAAGRARARMPRSLIIEPTRELAAQVAENFNVYGKYHKLSMALLIGGESFTEQQRLLERGVDVLIATPGRLLDLFERGKIILTDVRVLVIDEADRMLDMGFIPDVERIVSLLPPLRQTLFFSATMAPEIRRLADAFLSNPKEISVAPPASPALTVEQHLTIVHDEDKREALRELLRAEDVRNAIIFCNRKRDVDILLKSLVKYGFDAVALHGDMPQHKRTETLDRYRTGQVRLLVASDVAARGLDIDHVSHVFNFDVPIHAEDYVHRIGRTGRAGRSGKSFTLASPDDGRFVEAIEKMLGRAITRFVIPDIEPTEFAADEDGGRRGRGRGRSPARGASSPKPAAERSRSRGRKPAQSEIEAPLQASVPAPVRVDAVEIVPSPTPPAHAPASVEVDEQRDAPRRRRPAAARPTPAPAPAERVEAANGRDDRRPRRSGRHEQDDEPAPLGLGDHVPAFLLRPVPIARAR
ncbi:superfamily II DNA/RNA helicase [Constrictibacter sp. MBR-5]|jgi:superfamily II DNA/RNA helicase|uniref:DEAD/DEAH box helicase n=1 Tax=Constrictibacter sp. MBR-5 TaxID=3156467 RepID=UPI00339ABBEA